jgi:putative cell wall-binding protein
MRCRARGRFAVAAMLLCLLVVSGGSVPAQSAPLGERMAFGAWAPPAPWVGLEAIEHLEQVTGRRVDVVHFFETWRTSWDRFDRRALEAAGAGGRDVLLTWEPWEPGGSAEQQQWALRRIVEGEMDGLIRGWATGLRDHGRVVHLRPMHEMNGDWYPWSGVVNGNTPALFVAAWRHTHRLFQEAGAANVRWVWAPNVLDVPAGNRMEAYYPGAAYVDVLGLDGYNWGDKPGYGGWRSFHEIFDDAYRRVTALGVQPVWVTEVASDESGGDKAGWIADMLARRDYGRVEALLWFNERKELNWPVDSSPAAARAFHPAASPAPPEFEAVTAHTITRHAGSDRYATAALLAAATAHSDTVVVATAETFPDALAGATLAGAHGAPVLTTGRDRLPVSTMEALHRRDPNRVLVLGGPAAVSPAVEAAIGALLPDAQVSRIAGRNRYETAAAVAQAAAPATGRVRAAVVASGEAFPDALAMGPVAWSEQLPLLLTGRHRLADATRRALSELSVEEILVLGGPHAISEAVVADLRSLGTRVTRVAGGNRSATAAAIADYSVAVLGWRPTTATIVRGDAFPDALAAASFSGSRRSPLLLASDPRHPGTDTATWLGSAACTLVGVDVVGGHSVLGEDIERSIRQVLASGTAACPP